MKYLIVLFIPVFLKAATVNTGASGGGGTASEEKQSIANEILSRIESKLASTLSVSGSISSNVTLPSSQTVYQGEVWSVNVLNTPSVQSVSGSVSVNNQISGFSTSALQTLGNASLTSIDSKLSGPLSVNGNFFQATQPVSLLSVPTHAVTQGTTPWITSGSVTVLNPTTSVSITGITPTSATGITPISGNVSLSNQISGFNLETTQSSINSKIPSNLTVSGTRLLVELPASGGGGITNAEIRATPLAVSTTGVVSVNVNNPQTSVSVNNFPATQVVSGSVNILNSSIPVTGNFFQATQPISAISLPLPTGAATSALQSTLDTSINSLLKPSSTLAAVTSITNPVTVTGSITANIGTTNGLALESTQIATSNKLPSALVNDRMKVETFPVANDLGVTAVGAAAAAVTLTIPAVASQFHYIDSIEITLYSTAARTGNATPITCTTTNLSGNPAYTFATAGAIGTENTRQLNNANRPIKSSVVNTATTIVCPAVTGGLWRMNVRYSTGL
jgi:hypothetical protein